MSYPKEKFLGITKFNYWNFFVCDPVSDHIIIKLSDSHPLSNKNLQALHSEFDRILYLRFEDYKKAQEAWKQLGYKIFRTKINKEQIYLIKRDQKIYKKLIDLNRKGMKIEAAAFEIEDNPVNGFFLDPGTIREVYTKYNKKAHKEHKRYKQLNLDFVAGFNPDLSFDDFLDKMFFPCLDRITEAMELWLS